MTIITPPPVRRRGRLCFGSSCRNGAWIDTLRFNEAQGAAMHLTHLIVDDFFNNPERIREEALKLDFPPRPENSAYPGRNASTRLMIQGCDDHIARLAQEPLQPKNDSSHARPRLALEGETGEADVHMDFNHWSGIVYLSRPQDCREGTHFYRHKRTGLDRAPVFPGEAEAIGYPDGRSATEAILGEDANDPEKWEKTMTVPMRFNRLVLFRGYFWHDAGASFGSGKEDGRLILPLFYINTEAG